MQTYIHTCMHACTHTPANTYVVLCCAIYDGFTYLHQGRVSAQGWNPQPHNKKLNSMSASAYDSGIPASGHISLSATLASATSCKFRGKERA